MEKCRDQFAAFFLCGCPVGIPTAAEPGHSPIVQLENEHRSIMMKFPSLAISGGVT
jgi:hypothetical protein